MEKYSLEYSHFCKFVEIIEIVPLPHKYTYNGMCTLNFTIITIYSCTQCNDFTLQIKSIICHNNFIAECLIEFMCLIKCSKIYIIVPFIHKSFWQTANACRERSNENYSFDSMCGTCTSNVVSTAYCA